MTVHFLKDDRSFLLESAGRGADMGKLVRRD